MILLTHIGNPLPEYIPYSFAHLRKFNKDAFVQIILDPSLQSESQLRMCDKFNIEVVDSNQYRGDEAILELNRNTWIKDKHPLGPPTTYPSQDNFWHLTMERLFYIAAHMRACCLENILHIENDNVLFYDYKLIKRYTEGKVTCLERYHNGEDSTLFSVAFIPNHEQMDSICKTINYSISLGEKYLQDTYRFDHISEMHLLTLCRWMCLIDVLPSDHMESDHLFDPFAYAAYLFGTNNFQGPGFFDITDELGKQISEGRIKPILKNKVPYVIYDNYKKIPLFNLHMHRKKYRGFTVSNLDDHIDGDKFEELGKLYSIYYCDTYRLNYNNLITVSVTEDKMVLVTHNSDNEPPKIDLPDNIVRWYAQNLNHEDERAECIPIGLERKRWHDWEYDILNTAPRYDDRITRAFGMFNPRTYKQEREPLAQLCMDRKICAEYMQSCNGRFFDQYVSYLCNYAFCLCPRGNGIDTHRVWEALYLGCIPILKRGYVQYDRMFDDLPVMFVDDWREISYRKLEDFLARSEHIGYNYEKLKFEYWKKKIYESCLNCR